MIIQGWQPRGISKLHLLHSLQLYTQGNDKVVQASSLPSLPSPSSSLPSLPSPSSPTSSSTPLQPVPSRHDSRTDRSTSLKKPSLNNLVFALIAGALLLSVVLIALLCCVYMFRRLLLTFRWIFKSQSLRRFFTVCVAYGRSERRKNVLITYSEFTPFISTIVTSRHLVGQTVTSPVIWNDCYVIGYTSTMVISSGINQVTVSVIYSFDLFNISLLGNEQ